MIILFSPLEKSKPSVNFDPKKFSPYYSLFKIESNTATQEDKQLDSVDEEIEAIFFLLQKI